MTRQHPKLMIPGPVDVEDDILAALATPAPPHYGPQWLELYHEAIESLQQIFSTQNDVIPLAGPGSAGLDAALGSMMRTGEKVIVLSNGFFGQRMGIMAQNYGLDVRTITAPMGQPILPEKVRRRLSAEHDVQAVVMVHLETSSGVLNPLQEIASVANEFGVPLIVDAVSSLGGVPLPVDEWGIDVCVSVINKCLACPPGIAPLSVSQRAWDLIESKGGRAHGWYLNLRVWKDYALNWGNWHPTPTTMPTNNFVAMLVGLRRILNEGLQVHYDRFARTAQTVRARLEQLGFKLLTPEAFTSPLLTAVYGLPEMDVAAFRRYLQEEWQVMISGGLQELRGKIFRVGHIGRATSAEYTGQFLEGVEAYLRIQGYEVPPHEPQA